MHTRLLPRSEYTLCPTPHAWDPARELAPPSPVGQEWGSCKAHPLLRGFLLFRVRTDRQAGTLLQLKLTKLNIAAIFLRRRGTYKFTSSKVSLASAIHQTLQPHQSESIRNYSPSKLRWKALICYWSLLLFSSILKVWKQRSNNVMEIGKCSFYWDWWEPICHNICF